MGNDGKLEVTRGAATGRPAGVFDAASLINDAIDADPAVIDRLEALHPTFRRLRDQEGRETVGRMATLRDAAAIAELPVSVVVDVVNGRLPARCAMAGREAEPEPRPSWLDGFDAAAACHIDVRPILAAGHDPFLQVMAAVEEVPPGGALTIDAPFNPTPLRRSLAGRGFATFGQRLELDHWRIFCRHREAEEVVEPVATIPDPDARVWRGDDGTHIDVRGLERPRPLIAILSLIDGCRPAGPIVAHLDREPVFLYPELAERGWSHAIVPGEAGEIRLVIRKGGG
ncbi:MAG: DUF2249 domain-containing protein [Rhodospirillales bacterium]